MSPLPFPSFVLLIFNMTTGVLLYFHYHRPVCKWSLLLLASPSSMMGMYFFWNMQRLVHPRTVYLTMRWLNVLYYISLSLQPFVLIIMLADHHNYWTGSPTQLLVIRCLLYFVLSMTSFEMILCFSLLTGCTMFCKYPLFEIIGPCCVHQETFTKQTDETPEELCEIEMTRYDV